MPDPVPNSIFDFAMLTDTGLTRFLSEHKSEESQAIKNQELALAAVAGVSRQPARLAIVPVIGVLSKYGSWYGPATMELAYQVEQLANSGNVDGIMMVFDTPGGQAAYVYDAVEKFRAAAKKVPIHSYISDLCASGGFALASATQRISINPQGEAGCIGTYMVIRDFSKYLTDQGIKTYVVAAVGGKFKGMGVPGTEVSAEQIDYLQGRADSLNDHFLQTVSIGRRLSMDQAIKLADGRCFSAAECLKNGLVDAVCTFETAMNDLAMETKPRGSLVTTQKQSSDAKELSQMEPATFDQLKATLPEASAEFICQQLGAKASVQQAKAVWDATEPLRKQLAEKDAANAKLIADQQAATAAAATAAAAAGGKPLPGVKLAAGAGEAGAAAQVSDAQAYNEAIREFMKAGMSRLDAVCCVNKQQPELAQAFYMSTNPGAKAQSLIKDKFAQKL